MSAEQGPSPFRRANKFASDINCPISGGKLRAGNDKRLKLVTGKDAASRENQLNAQFCGGGGSCAGILSFMLGHTLVLRATRVSRPTWNYTSLPRGSKTKNNTGLRPSPSPRPQIVVLLLFCDHVFSCANMQTYFLPPFGAPASRHAGGGWPWPLACYQRAWLVCL